jgi:TRAP-type transport system small permease protein
MRLRRIENLVEKANRCILGVSVFFLGATVVIVILNVVSRYLFHLSLTWSAEIARYAMIWSALLAAAVLVNRREHLAVDLVSRGLGVRARRGLELFVGLVSLTFYVLLGISGGWLVQRTSGQVVSSVDVLPMGLVYAVVPVSALLMFLGGCVNLWRILEGREPAS